MSKQGKNNTNTELPLVTVFVSSPGDVIEERNKVRDILQHLQETEFADKLVIRAIFWEDNALVATQNYQEQIPSPTDVDIFIAILWSRLGTPLDPEKYQNNKGKQYSSGTEYEIEQALTSHNNSPKDDKNPQIYIFYNENEPHIPLRPREDSEKRKAQYYALGDFLEKLEFHPTYKEICSNAINRFTNKNKFSELVTASFMKSFKKIIEEDEIAITWLDNPFRGLNHFDFIHAPIFFGRKEISKTIHSKLLELIKVKKAFMLIGGSSGIGKSSFVRAGVLPLLLYPVSNWRFAEIRVADIIKDTKDFSDVLAHTLTLERKQEDKLPSALPELIRNSSVEELSIKIKKNFKIVLGEIFATLKVLSEKASDKIQNIANENIKSEVKLCLLLDQAEEFFTTNNLSHQEVIEFFSVMRSMAESGQIVVIATMRADCLGYCENIPDLQYLKESDGYYHLSPPSFDEITSIIRDPAKVAGVNFEQKDGKSLDKSIVEDAYNYDVQSKNATILPVLEFALSELYVKSPVDENKRKQLSFDEYEKMGKLEKAIPTKAKEVYAEYKQKHSNADFIFSKVMDKLIDTEKGKAIRKKALLSSFLPDSKERELLELFVEARLLYTEQGDEERSYVSLAHDSLLEHWDLLAEWIEKNSEILSRLEEFNNSFEKWLNNAKDEGDFLPKGRQIENAKLILHERPDRLSEEQAEYIETSKAKIDAEENELRRLYEETKKAKNGAEKLIDFMLEELAARLANTDNGDILVNLNRAIDTYYEKLDEESDDKTSLFSKSRVLRKQGDVLLSDNKIEIQEILPYYLKSAEIAHQLYLKQNSNFEYGHNEAVSLAKIAHLHRISKDYTIAREYYNKALEIYQRFEKHKISSISVQAQNYMQVIVDELDKSYSRGDRRNPKIYLVADDDLQDEVFELEKLLEGINHTLKPRHISFELYYHGVWTFDEIQDCDFCFVLYHKKFGEFNEESFRNTYKLLDSNNRLEKMYVFFKDTDEEDSSLKNFKKNFAKNYGYFFSNFKNIDSLKLYFVMQLDNYLNNFFSNHNLLQFSDQSISLASFKIANINNIPFAGNNRDYTRMCEQLMSYSNEIEKLRLKVIKYPYDENFQYLLQQKLSTRNKLKSEFEQYQTSLFSTALRIAKCKEGRISERMKRAIDYFDNGMTNEANAILSEAEHDVEAFLTEYKKHKELSEQEKENLTIMLESLSLKAETIISDTALPLDERIINAKNVYEKAREIALNIEHDKEKTNSLLSDYADFLKKYTYYDSALAVYIEQLAIVEELYGTEHESTAMCLNNIGEIHSFQGELDKALTYYSKAFEICEKVLDSEHSYTSIVYSNIGGVYDMLGNYDKALRYYNKALAIQEKEQGKEHSDTAISYQNIGLVYVSMGYYEEALEHCNNALAIFQNTFGSDHQQSISLKEKIQDIQQELSNKG